MSSYTWNSTATFLWIKEDRSPKINKDGEQSSPMYILWRFLYTGDIYRSDCKISIYERALWERNLHMCSKQTRFSVSWNSLGDGVSEQKKINYFIDFLGRNFTHCDLKFKRLVYQVSRRLQCLDSKLSGDYLLFLG